MSDRTHEALHSAQQATEAARMAVSWMDAADKEVDTAYEAGGVARTGFLEHVGPMMEAQGPDFARNFTTTEEYYRVLAAMGLSVSTVSRRDRESLALMIEALHTPGLPVILKQSMNRPSGATLAYAVGKIIGDTFPQMVPVHADSEDSQQYLSLAVNTTIEGSAEPQRTYVAVDSIHAAYTTTAPSALSLAVGPRHIRQVMSPMYRRPLHTYYDGRDYTPARLILEAACAGGLLAADIDMPEAEIQSLRNTTLQRLGALCRSGRDYYNDELPVLAGLYPTRGEVVAAVDAVLDGVSPADISVPMASHYDLLRAGLPSTRS